MIRADLGDRDAVGAGSRRGDVGRPWISGRLHERDDRALVGKRFDGDRFLLKGGRVVGSETAVDDIAGGAADARKKLPLDGDGRLRRRVETAEAVHVRGIPRRDRTTPALGPARPRLQHGGCNDRRPTRLRGYTPIC